MNNRPIIGRLYRPKSFETRRQDGTFQAYNRPLFHYEDALQRAYLAKPEDPWPTAWPTAAVAVEAALALTYLTWGWM
jgi:hypothetical protein